MCEMRPKVRMVASWFVCDTERGIRRVGGREGWLMDALLMRVGRWVVRMLGGEVGRANIAAKWPGCSRSPEMPGLSSTLSVASLLPS